MSLTTEDRLAVRDLVVRYARAVDTPVGEDELQALFADDAVMDGPNGPVRGREAVSKLAKLIAAAPERQSRHLVANLLVDGAGDEATVTAYFLRVKTPVDPSSGLEVQTSVGTYDLTVRRIDGAWRLSRRVVRIDGA